MRSHRPTKKEPFARYTQRAYKKNRFTVCLLVPNVVEKKVFVIRKYRTVSSRRYTVSFRLGVRPSDPKVSENGYRVQPFD